MSPLMSPLMSPPRLAQVAECDEEDGDDGAATGAGTSIASPAQRSASLQALAEKGKSSLGAPAAARPAGSAPVPPPCAPSHKPAAQVPAVPPPAACGGGIVPAPLPPPVDAAVDAPSGCQLRETTPEGRVGVDPTPNQRHAVSHKPSSDRVPPTIPKAALPKPATTKPATTKAATPKPATTKIAPPKPTTAQADMGTSKPAVAQLRRSGMQAPTKFAAARSQQRRRRILAAKVDNTQQTASLPAGKTGCKRTTVRKSSVNSHAPPSKPGVKPRVEATGVTRRGAVTTSRPRSNTATARVRRTLSLRASKPARTGATTTAKPASRLHPPTSRLAEPGSRLRKPVHANVPGTRAKPSLTTRVRRPGAAVRRVGSAPGQRSRFGFAAQ